MGTILEVWPDLENVGGIVIRVGEICSRTREKAEFLVAEVVTEITCLRQFILLYYRK